MEKRKVKFKVEKIVEEHNTKGSKLLKVFISCAGKTYTKVVKKADYLDEGIRLGLHRLWIKGLKEEMAEDNKSEGKKKTDAKLLVDMVGSEVEDEEG